MSKPYVIGISGGSASGKSHLLNQIRNSYTTEEVCIIAMDDYYKAKTDQPLDQKGIHNFDTPESIDHKLFLNDLRLLKDGVLVKKEEYTFNNPNKTPVIKTLIPAPAIIVEGIFILYFNEILGELDIKLFVDAKDYIRLKRRIHRDNIERGYNLEDVLYRYEYHVDPAYERYIKPLKNIADLIIPNNTDFSKASEMLISFIRTKIHD
jgi:uridine kinase